MTVYEIINWLLVALMAFCVFKAIKGIHGPYSWFWAIMAFSIMSVTMMTTLRSLNLIPSFRVNEYYQNMYSEIILVNYVFVFLGFIFVRFFLQRKVLKMSYPALVLPIKQVVSIMIFLSFLSVLGQISLQVGGYSGYFRDPSISTNPPVWLDMAGKIVRVGFLLFFVIALTAQLWKRPMRSTYLLCALWTISGFLSGFKLQVFLPVAMIAVTSWLAGRFRPQYAVYTVVAMIAAYTIIEPLRQFRDQTGEVDVVSAFSQLREGNGVEIYTLAALFDRVTRRFDNTSSGVQAVQFADAGQLPEFKHRLDEMYSHWFAMAFVPRAFWPEKPLSNLGSVISAEMYKNRNNSVAVTKYATTHIWGGFTAISIFGFMSGVFVGLSSIYIWMWLKSPVALLPVFIIAVNLTFGNEFQLFHFVSIMRGVVALFVFVIVGRIFGFVKFVRLRQAREAPVRQAPMYSGLKPAA